MDPKDEIKQKLDIITLIGEYLELKPAGMHGFRALCPFHGEKTPSFHVSSDRQIFHCFGCGEGGDVFTFVQKMEGMDFPEVLMHLGKKTGVEVKRFDSTEGNVKQRLLLMHDLSAAFYKKVLTESSIAELARTYLNNRGITETEIAKFGIGFAPDDWSRLSEVLLKRGFSETELVQAGLSFKKKSGSGVIDRFRNRIMIPLRDQHGNTVGFTGRVLPGYVGDQGKYMNSPDTPIYHKGHLVFGLDLGKRVIKEMHCAIIVEGNLDVVASHKAQVENVVASSGTALTSDQLELLKRYTDTVVFCFDRDAAGLNAAKKGVSIARALHFDVRAITLPNDVKDPDDLVQKNPDRWRKLSASSIPFMQFLFERTCADRDLANIDHKRQVYQELKPAIRELQDIVEKEHWMQKISLLLNVDFKTVRDDIALDAKPKLKSEIHAQKSQPKLSQKDQCVLLLLGVVLNNDLYRTKALDELSRITIEHEDLRELYNFIANEYTIFKETAKNITFFTLARSSLQNDPIKKALLTFFDQASLLAEETFESLASNAVLTQLNNLFETLHSHDRHTKRSVIAQKLRQAESAGDDELVKKLLDEYK